MANDRMKNDDLDRDKQDFGKQTPGRNPQQDKQTGQKGQDKPSQAEGEDSDEFGGQNR